MLTVDAASVHSEPRVPETLSEFTASADEGATLLFEAFRETGDPESIVSVRTFTDRAEGLSHFVLRAGEAPRLLADAPIRYEARHVGEHAGCLAEAVELVLVRADQDQALVHVALLDRKKSQDRRLVHRVAAQAPDGFGGVGQDTPASEHGNGGGDVEVGHLNRRRAGHPGRCRRSPAWCASSC